MNSQRQKKFSKLILQELANIFLKEANSRFGNVFITVTDTEVSPDLSVAKIHLSIMLSDKKEQILKKIKQDTKFIRTELAMKIKKQVRIIPNLVFFLDESADYAQKMDSIITSLNIPKELN